MAPAHSQARYDERMGQAILLLVTVGVTIYAVVDCLRCDSADVRALAKPMWLVVIILLPLVGGLLWIFLGDGSAPGHSFGHRRVKVVAPDDDPDFLRTLDPHRRREDD